MVEEKSRFSAAPKDGLFALGRSILFQMDPEKAHDLALSMLKPTAVKRMVARRYQVTPRNTAAMGMHFDNPVGLAAGLDKNADYIDALGAIGFGHIEVGTVTPKPQKGNEKPRIFRLPGHQALINRLGFNNKGVDHLVRQVEKCRYTGKLGINIGKNLSTEIEQAEKDYLHCLERVYPLADYVTVNISSPNTQGLRDLQHGQRLQALLESLKNAQSRLASKHQRHVPLVIKIAPDMSDAELDVFCQQILQFEIEALISGNTTNSRLSASGHLYARETGGLSGKPLFTLANDRLKALRARLDSKVTLIGTGGIGCGNDALSKLNTGADLVQLYTGLIYHGPALVRDCIDASR
jgi:dihydroorotate dehydrogenase